MELIRADIIRDGGSIVADFRQEDGALLSILLEIGSDSEPRTARRFKHLHVGPDIQNACTRETLVAKGSVSECELLLALDLWLAAPKLADSARLDQLAWVRELREQLEMREV